MKPNQLRAAEKATIAAFGFIVFSTIYSEINSPFKKFLAATFGHHWVGKGILSILVFALVYYYFSTRPTSSNEKLDYWKMAQTISIAAIVGGMVIFGFFAWELFA